MKDVLFVTGNPVKWEIGRDIFSQYDINLNQETMEAIEIQSLDVVEVAKTAALFAAKEIDKPCIKLDVGYYIEALNGFPGPFIKFINQTLSADDIIDLMSRPENRAVTVRECLAYVEHEGKTMSFVHEEYYTIATKADKGKGSSIDKVIIIDGFEKPESAYDHSVFLDHWKKTLHIYHDMAKAIVNTETVMPDSVA